MLDVQCHNVSSINYNEFLNSHLSGIFLVANTFFICFTRVLPPLIKCKAFVYLLVNRVLEIPSPLNSIRCQLFKQWRKDVSIRIGECIIEKGFKYRQFVGKNIIFDFPKYLFNRICHVNGPPSRPVLLSLNKPNIFWPKNARSTN